MDWAIGVPGADGEAAVAERHAIQCAKDVAQMRIVEPRAPVLELAEQLVLTHALRAHDAVQPGRHCA